MEKFEAYFIKCQNPIFECTKFNMHKQGETLVDEFITDLSFLAKHCGYNDLHDKMIRGRIIVEIWDSQLSEKLQMESNLMLKKALTLLRQSKSEKTQ